MLCSKYMIVQHELSQKLINPNFKSPTITTNLSRFKNSKNKYKKSKRNVKKFRSSKSSSGKENKQFIFYDGCTNAKSVLRLF